MRQTGLGTRVAMQASTTGTRSNLSRPQPLRLEQAASNRGAIGPGNRAHDLALSWPADSIEHEADRMADAALRTPAVAAGGCECGGTCGSCVGRTRESMPADRLPLLRRAVERARAPGRQTTAASAAAGRAAGARVASIGRPLEPATRAFFEPRFGADLAGVRVHADAAADGAARSASAHAYTAGSHIVFAAGRYAPDTQAGRRLLAHELAHVVQGQRGEVPLRTLLRRWDPAVSECASEASDKWIERVVVEQETPQSVTLHWSDGSVDTGSCSGGKGQCCVDPATPDAVACTSQESRREGTNCTPITEGAGYAVVHRDLDHRGIPFWSEFVPPPRYIALHEYSPVDGTPLSHGCVRLHPPMARKIFCGVRQHQTRVQVRGFARPRCDHPQLQDEWRGDFQSAGRPLDGEEPRAAQSIRTARTMLRRALGTSESDVLARARQLSERTDDFARGTPAERARTRTAVAAAIPRCAGRGALPTPEERQVTADIAGAGMPTRILASSGYDRRLVPFMQALRRAASFTAAERAVLDHARRLWEESVSRAQNAAAVDTDDRPLYWSRLEMTRALRQWAPRFSLSEALRARLIERFDRVSRGMEHVRFPGDGEKRILISGFDPFGLRSAAMIGSGNPSGAAVLALDGVSLRSGGVSGHVEGVIFPVRFADFDAGSVERFFRPFLDGTQPVDMIMTVSQGGGAQFEVEEFAGRRRSAGSFRDNRDATGGGTRTAPSEPRGLAAGPEFLETALPTAAMRGALGRTNARASETEITEIPRGSATSVRRPTGGPSAGSTAVAGSGGGFLSNEIFYRTALLRRSTGATIPVGHLHTPHLPLPGATATTAFTLARDRMVRTIRRLLEAVLAHI